ncbi:hypothetical protein HPB49_015544 [Dermacentor silvarum]|uniref:Uncharacterized protein n=1 Tax=Dermacentor silvarum TaxID=543639 RepID=A0ACB8D6H9_DERSI|nr:hypothetical protein HPB49_015544 [Dermacentor silvarum]
MEANATCADHLCVCPSLQPLAEAGHCDTIDSSLPLALGTNCTDNAQCSHFAACMQGQCSCPPNYEPSDERHCHAARLDALSMTSWIAVLILTSGFLVMLLLAVYVFMIGQRRAAHTSIMMTYCPANSSRPPSLLLVPATSIDTAAAQYDDGRISTGFGTDRQHPMRDWPYPGARDSWLEALDLHAQDAPEGSEPHYSLSLPINPFTLQGNSEEKRCASESLLQSPHTPTLPSSRESGSHESSASEKTPTSVSSGSSFREQLTISSVAWGSIGNSLDSLLSIPVVARVHTRSRMTETTSESKKELYLSVEKF